MRRNSKMHLYFTFVKSEIKVFNYVHAYKQVFTVKST